MPVIKPISDLRNNFNKISEICHHDAEPVFITKNGQGDLVVLSIALYEKMQHQVELYRKLLDAEAQSMTDVNRTSHADLISKLREKINAKTL